MGFFDQDVFIIRPKLANFLLELANHSVKQRYMYYIHAFDVLLQHNYKSLSGRLFASLISHRCIQISQKIGDFVQFRRLKQLKDKSAFKVSIVNLRKHYLGFLQTSDVGT